MASSGSSGQPYACPSAPRFELVTAEDGEVIALRDYSSRIVQETDISWDFRIAAELLDWPPGSLSIEVGGRRFKWCHRIALRDRTTLLELRVGCVRKGAMEPTDTLTLVVVPHDPPEKFEREEGCICDFRGHGCCVTGRTDGVSQCREQIMQRGQEAHYGCRWCGEGGCCRSGNCGHPCCEEAQEYYMDSSDETPVRRRRRRRRRDYRVSEGAS